MRRGETVGKGRNAVGITAGVLILTVAVVTSVVLLTQRQEQETEGEKRLRSVKSYDAEGKLVGTSVYEYGEYVYAHLDTVGYHGDAVGKETKITIYDADGEEEGLTVRLYNQEGNLVSNYTEMLTYTYGHEVPANRKGGDIYEYNEHNDLIREFHWTQAGYPREMIYRCEYDETDRLIRRYAYIVNNEGDLETYGMWTREEYRYDEEGRLIEQTSYGDRYEEIFDHLTYEYIYDNDGNLTKIVNDDAGDHMGLREWYTYNHDGILIDSGCDGDCESDDSRCEYDEQGHVIREFCYNAWGELVRTNEYEYETTGVGD